MVSKNQWVNTSQIWRRDFALGEGWDEDSQKFLINATYYRRGGEYEWEQTRRRWQQWYFTFDPEYAPGKPISEYEFLSLE